MLWRLLFQGFFRLDKFVRRLIAILRQMSFHPRKAGAGSAPEPAQENKKAKLGSSL
jgi:hypothetical protein